MSREVNEPPSSVFMTSPAWYRGSFQDGPAPPRRIADWAAPGLSTSQIVRPSTWRGSRTSGASGASSGATHPPKAFSSSGSTSAVTSPTTTRVAPSGV